MSRRQYDGQDADIDIARLFAAVWERRLAVISLILIVGVAAFVISGMIPPRYLGETRILIESREPVFVEGASREAGQAQTLDERGVASQVEIINSTDLIKAVAEDLDLANTPDFSAAAHPSFLTKLMARFGLAQDLEDAAPEERLIETFREHLTVYQVANSRVIVVEFWSTDNQLAATVANTIATTYLSMQSGAKLVTNADATAWLLPEIEELRERVRLAEEKVANYRAESGLLLVDENATLVTQQLADASTELARIRAQKADALARAAVVKRAVERGETSGQFVNAVDSEVMQRLRDRHADIQSNIADLSVTLLDGHPRIKGLRSQLRDIETQIRAETAKQLRGLEAEAELAQIREDELQTQLNSLKAESARAGNEEVELRALEREATAQRDLLEAYLSRYREAASRSDRGNLPADARVIATAIVPASPYFPKTMPIVIVAALSTFLLSSIVIMLRELFAGSGLKTAEPEFAPEPAASLPEPAAPPPEPASARSIPAPPEPEDAPPEPEEKPDSARKILETRIGAAVSRPTSSAPPVVEETPKVDEKPESDAETEDLAATLIEKRHSRLVSANDSNAPQSQAGDTSEPPAGETPEPAASEQEETDAIIVEPDAEYSVSAVTGHLIAKGTRLAVVVSPEGDKGSTTSVMLARMLANEGRQTLLLDMTGSACPSRMMTPQSDLPGITNVLAGECSTPNAVHADRLSNAHILPRGTADPAKAMLHSSELPGVIEAVAGVYDIVVVECGPANSDGVKQLLGRENGIEMIFSVVQPDEKLITEYLTDFYSEGFDNLLMMSPGAGNSPNKPGRAA